MLHESKEFCFFSLLECRLLAGQPSGTKLSFEEKNEDQRKRSDWFRVMIIFSPDNQSYSSSYAQRISQDRLSYATVTTPELQRFKITNFFWSVFLQVHHGLAGASVCYNHRRT